jgi:HD-GYP domain-containing protein (c-di-GMP phosphodiesterase class II)
MGSLNDQPLYSSRIINTYVKLIKKRYSFINLGELLKQSKMKSYQIEDEGHWFTQEQVDLFYENVKKLTRNNRIAREAGRYAASPEAMGVMRHFILGCVDPATAYLMLEKAVPNFTKSSIFKVSQINSSAVEIIVETVEDTCEKHYQCENRIGYIEAVSLIFNYRLPTVKHPECIFNGGRVCRYIVSWKSSRSVFCKKVRNYVTLSMSILCATAGFMLPKIAFLPLVLGSLFIFLLFSLYAECLHKNEYQFALKSLMGSSDKLLNQINVNYNNAMLANELGQSINKKLSVEGVASEVIQVVQKRLDYDRGIILMVDKQRKKLYYQDGFGYTETQMETLRNTDFNVDNPESKGIFVLCVLNKKPFLINNVDDIVKSLSPKSLEYMKLLESTSFICCPIIYESEALGIFVVDNINNKRPLYQSDMSLLMGIAPEIGISIHNATLIESKERQFKSILQTLAASIDARDPLTAGHSERVTQYSLGICREMNLPDNFCEIIKVAALLHDYGKIGISDSILKKEEALTPEEYQQIQTHAEKTRKILEQINFEGIYSAVPEIAGSHHEKFDGSGYPNGLKGMEIPLGARIIAVADVFEAITSKRHYRNPMPENIALGIIAHQSGTHFDGEIVQAFFRYYNKLKTGDEQQIDLLIDREKNTSGLFSSKGLTTSADNQRCIGKSAGV